MAKAVKIGYDIGVSTLKIAIARGDSFRFVEERLPEHLVDGDSIAAPNAFSQFLKKVRHDHKVPKGPAALSLPAGQSICRFITMPTMTEEQLLINLPYEFADFTHENDDQYYCDYALCTRMPNDPEDAMPMMAAASEKMRLTAYESMFSRAGVELTTILPPEMSLVALAQRSPDRDVCFVDLGQRQTRVIAIRADRVQATREIPVGLADVDQAIAAHFAIDPFLASAYKFGNFDNCIMLPECLAVYERIAVELLKVINFYQFTYRDSELHGIYLIGGGAYILPLRQSIAAALEADPLPLSEILSDAGAAGAYAAGAILGGR